MGVLRLSRYNISVVISTHAGCKHHDRCTAYKILKHLVLAQLMSIKMGFPPADTSSLYRFSAMTLCNLSTHADCKTQLVSMHGLPPLIDMLEGESDLVKRYAAMTLCNLSTLAENQVHMSG